MCAVASEVSALANAQLGIVGMEMEWEVAAGCSIVVVHSGTSPETLTGPEGASVNTAMLVVLVVQQSEWKTGPCAAFDVKVAGQETNTTWGVPSNSGVGTIVRLPFRAGMGTLMSLPIRYSPMAFYLQLSIIFLTPQVLQHLPR